jgi:hypothetical protein
MVKVALTSCLIAALSAASAYAQAVTVAEPTGEAAVASTTDKQHWSDLDSILRNAEGHPNEIWRLHGAESAARGDWKDAYGFFRRAARYADKYSQHRISLMYWHGVGVAPDRALAYAWADLAAERMYPQFVLLREKMWAQMDEGQRKQAIAEGQAIYDEFGDAVAKKRFADAMAQAKRRTTGSHTGFVGTLVVQAPGSGGNLSGGPGSAKVSELYEQSRWDVKNYWKIEEVMWSIGFVDVGPLERVEGAAPPPPTSPTSPTPAGGG